jgi:hypothetical protein
MHSKMHAWLHVVVDCVFEEDVIEVVDNVSDVLVLLEDELLLVEELDVLLLVDVRVLLVDVVLEDELLLVKLLLVEVLDIRLLVEVDVVVVEVVVHTSTSSAVIGPMGS